MQELIKIDLEYRWRPSARAADRLRLEDYVRKYPALGALRELPTDLLGEEYRALTHALVFASLKTFTQEVFVIWNVVGLAVYFLFGGRASRLAGR